MSRISHACLVLTARVGFAMMLGRRILKAILVAGLGITADALAVRKQNLNELIRPYKRAPLQDIVRPPPWCPQGN